MICPNCNGFGAKDKAVCPKCWGAGHIKADTPRTIAQVERKPVNEIVPTAEFVPADFCRELERDLSAALAEVSRLYKLASSRSGHFPKVIEENITLRAKIAAMEATP